MTIQAHEVKFSHEVAPVRVRLIVCPCVDQVAVGAQQQNVDTGAYLIGGAS